MWGSVPCEGRVRRIELGIALFSETASNYALEWFSEAGSAPIRSAVKFYFDIDVRIFSQLFLIFFFSNEQTIFWKIDNSRQKLKKSEKSKFQNLKNQKFQNLENLKMFIFFDDFFWSIEKIFFVKLKKNPDIKRELKFHCGSNGSTPSLWKPTLKHSLRRFPKKGNS